MKWYEIFCQTVKPWTLQFVTDHNDLLQVAQTSPNYKLTQIFTCHCKLNSFLYRIIEVIVPHVIVVMKKLYIIIFLIVNFLKMNEPKCNLDYKSFLTLIFLILTLFFY